MTTSAVTTISTHPSGVLAFSLRDAPALIESLLPVQNLSIDVFKEREARQAQTLTALGSYWKGRKPLVLNRACVLASLLPATDNPARDLETFELLMGMDELSQSKRAGLLGPSDLVQTIRIPDISRYFTIEPEGHPLPNSAPFNLQDYPYRKIVKGQEKTGLPRLRWREDVSENEKHALNVLALEQTTYRDLVSSARRAEEVGPSLHSHIWERVNAHLGTNAQTLSELVAQLGVMRFGRLPVVADTFSGSGQIPFAAAQLGCEVYASDLNPISCMLTWGAANIVGAQPHARETLKAQQKALVRSVRAEIEALNVETDGRGWRGKVYLYCLEVTCPSSGWKVPVLPTRIISKGKKAIVQLVPDALNKRYDIEVKSEVSSAELAAASVGTYREGSVCHTVNGVDHINSIKAIRGDYEDTENGVRVRRNRLRPWIREDFAFKDDDIFSERLYAIQWIKEGPMAVDDDGNEAETSARQPTEFRSVTAEDLVREQIVLDFVEENLANWQGSGAIPDTRIEPGDETERLYRERGWTHWHHLFNPRQLLIFGLLNSRGGAASKFPLFQALNNNCRLSRWHPFSGVGQTVGVFDSQALNTLFNYGCRGFSFLSSFLLQEYRESHPIRLLHLLNVPSSQIPYTADIFVTDPPYGDAVKYEEILEFFIAWLRKNPPPEFADWTWDSRRELAVKGEDHDFRLSMVAAYKRMAERMPDNGIQILMFTHQDGNIWADMANIVWASGLRVTAAWYLVTETDSALREGSYVKGTILLVLRKRLGVKRTNQTDLAYELEEEVAEQIKRLTGMNDSMAADSKRAKDGNLFEDADLQMAGYAAALKVLTKYSIIDGKDMAQEALRPRVSGQKTLVESLIDFATDTANKMLVPLGLAESVWHDLEPAERFYLKMLEQESHGLNKLDNYQNFAKAFAIRSFSALMASENANKAALKSAKEFGRAEMNQSSELYQTPTRAVLYALMDLQTQKDLDDVLKGLEQNLKPGAFYSSRDLLVAIARFIGKKVEVMRPDEASAARVLADGIENQRM